MIPLNLKTKAREQELVKQYLEENVSPMLADKINNGVPAKLDGKPLINKKNLDGFFSFAAEEARKLVEKGARVACIEKQTVFGWAVHYFEEDSIIGKLYYLDGTEYQPPKPKPNLKSASTPYTPPKPQPKPQMSFFDLMDEEPEKPAQEEVLEDDDDYPTEEEQQEILRECAEEEIKKEAPKGSPLYQRFADLQMKYPNSVITMRLGDFYEVFGDNASVLADELDLTLTGRDCGLDSRVPMIGFPYHAAELYFNKISNRHSIVILEGDEIRQIPMKAKTPNETVDLDTGEILSEEEMQEFDGDIYEPQNVPDDIEQDCEMNNDTLRTLSAIFGETLIVR